MSKNDLESSIEIIKVYADSEIHCVNVNISLLPDDWNELETKSFYQELVLFLHNKRALLKQEHLAKSIEKGDPYYLTPRERLERGYILDGDEFDMLMKEEEVTNSVVQQLVEIRKLLIDITHLLGVEEKIYIDGKLILKSELPSSNQ